MRFSLKSKQIRDSKLHLGSIDLSFFDDKLYYPALAMVTCFGPFVTIICKSRQARKGATVAGTSSAKVC